MKISIIIPAFNEEKLIGKTLSSVAESAKDFTARGWSVEQVVCDNNSTDRTAEIAAAHGARVIFEPVNQISRARNAGASIATGDWFVFVDADSLVTPGIFAGVASNIADGRCIGGGCLVQLDEDLPRLRWIVRSWNLISVAFGWAAGSFIFCDARAFRAVNGFSTALYASEEVDFSRRIKEVGRRENRRFTIIRNPRLVTSARKIHLYSRGELFRFFVKAIFLPRKFLTSSSECALWYDGRR